MGRRRPRSNASGMLVVLIACFVLGVVAGMRAALAPAALFLARGGILGYILALAALGELVGDVLPRTPPRTAPPGLIARIVSGGICGWVLSAAHGTPPVAGAVAGVIGALAGTYGGFALRARLASRIGAIPAAVAEDVVAIVLAACTLIAVSPR